MKVPYGNLHPARPESAVHLAPRRRGWYERVTAGWRETRDGERIAFGDVPAAYGLATGGECIHIYDLAKRTTTDVPGSVGLWSSRWSPDGRFIAATRITDRALMLYDVVAKKWRDLNLPHVGELTWSPDGQAIFAEPERPAHWFVRVHIPDGRLEPQIDVAGEALHFGAGVTLDGRPLFLRTSTDVYALHLERK